MRWTKNDTAAYNAFSQMGSDIKGMIRFHNAVQGSDMQVLSYSDCHILFRRGSLGIRCIGLDHGLTPHGAPRPAA